MSKMRLKPATIGVVRSCAIAPRGEARDQRDEQHQHALARAAAHSVLAPPPQRRSSGRWCSTAPTLLSWQMLHACPTAVAPRCGRPIESRVVLVDDEHEISSGSPSWIAWSSAAAMSTTDNLRVCSRTARDRTLGAPMTHNGFEDRTVRSSTRDCLPAVAPKRARRRERRSHSQKGRTKRRPTCQTASRPPSSALAVVRASAPSALAGRPERAPGRTVGRPDPWETERGVP